MDFCFIKTDGFIIIHHNTNIIILVLFLLLLITIAEINSYYEHFHTTTAKFPPKNRYNIFLVSYDTSNPNPSPTMQCQYVPNFLSIVSLIDFAAILKEKYTFLAYFLMQIEYTRKILYTSFELVKLLRN